MATWGPKGGPSGYASEELGDRTKHLEDVEDAGHREFLLVEVLDIDGDVAQHVGGASLTEYLDSAQRIEYHRIDFSVLDIADGTFAECYDIAVVYLRLHRVAGDVAPELCLLETRHYDVTGWYCHLTVEDFVETSDKIDIEVGCSLSYFHRNMRFWSRNFSII